MHHFVRETPQFKTGGHARKQTSLSSTGLSHARFNTQGGVIHIDKTLNLNICPYLLLFSSHGINLWLQRDRCKPCFNRQPLHRDLFASVAKHLTPSTPAPGQPSCRGPSDGTKLGGSILAGKQGC